jgi:hypothetical protein
MLDFNIVDIGEYNFRCVLGEDIYFDFTVEQFELFGYDHFFSQVKSRVGYPIFEASTDKKDFSKKRKTWGNLFQKLRGIKWNRYFYIFSNFLGSLCFYTFYFIVLIKP